jgi:CTP synthase
VNIAVVGKYTSLLDSYKSLAEALIHGGLDNNVTVRLNWVDSEIFEGDNADMSALKQADGIMVPGGFGQRGSEGKIKAIQFARENQLPFFGICFGMQMAVIEAARNLADQSEASSSEFGQIDNPVVGLMTEWTSGNAQVTRDAESDLGGTMRLGAYDCVLGEGTRVRDLYGVKNISERHRHRYEVNVSWRDMLEEKGLIFSGLSPDGALPEIVERPDHPFFIGVQFHPELKSRPFQPHPLFSGFIKAARDRSRLV